jgi:predicted transcriptional regulator
VSAIDERVLERIRRDAGATNVGLLASDLGLKFSTVEKAVARLMRAGRVERTEDGGLTTTIEEAREHAFNVEAMRRYKTAVKSAKQLDVEIAEALAKKAADPSGKIRAAKGQFHFQDRFKLMSPEARERGPRWTAFVSVFGHDVSGEGDKKPEALNAALSELPEHLRRHFA